MARNGNPDDDFYNEPTQYSDYGSTGGQAYSEYQQQSGYPADNYGYPADQPTAPRSPEPWYRKPAGLIGLGAAGVVIAALVIYAIVSLMGKPADTAPTGTTSSTTAPNEEAPAGGGSPEPGGTETVTVAPTTEAPATTTEAPATTSQTPTTTPPPTVSTSTVTETVTQSRTRPTWTFPRPSTQEGGQ